MARFNLLVNGSTGPRSHARITFYVLFAIAVAVCFMPNPSIFNDNTDNTDNIEKRYVFYTCVTIVSMLIYYLIVITRAYVRRRDRIPEGCCVGCEDCCVSILFPLCTISQLMRHTGNYRVYRGVWCSTTGLPDGVVSQNSDDSHV